MTRSSLTWMVGCAVAYALIGKFFPNPIEHQFYWRLGSWLACVVVFLAHVAFEQFSAKSPATVMSLRVAAAVAIGALGLAVMGPLWTRWSSDMPIGSALLALVLWPAISAIPAYLAARVIGAIMARFRWHTRG